VCAKARQFCFLTPVSRAVHTPAGARRPWGALAGRDRSCADREAAHRSRFRGGMLRNKLRGVGQRGQDRWVTAIGLCRPGKKSAVRIGRAAIRSAPLSHVPYASAPPIKDTHSNRVQVGDGRVSLDLAAVNRENAALAAVKPRQRVAMDATSTPMSLILVSYRPRRNRGIRVAIGSCEGGRCPPLW